LIHLHIKTIFRNKYPEQPYYFTLP